MALSPSDFVMQDISMQAIMDLDLAESDAAAATALVASVKAILATWRTAVAAINGNDNLSPTGKAAQIATQADRAQRDLQMNAGGQLASIAGSIVKLDAMLNPPTVSNDDAIETALRIEIRDVLRKRDARQNTVILLAAAARGDSRTMRAILEPPFFEATREFGNVDDPVPPFAIDPQTILNARTIFAERAAPEVAASLKTLRSAYATLEALLNDASKEVGGSPGDPLIEMAGLPKPNGGTQPGASA